MKRIFVLGNPNSVILYRYALSVHEPGVTELIIATDTDNFLYRSLYEQHGFTVIRTTPFQLAFLVRLPRLRNFLKYLYYYLYMFPKLKHMRFDGIHVHSMSAYSLFVARHISASTRLVCTYWGSDLKRNPVTNDDARWCLRYAAHIVVPTIEMKNHFVQIFGHTYSNKLRIIKFGVTGFDHIDKVLAEFTPVQCKQQLGISTEYITVAIGYNAYRAQQHLEVINALSLMPSQQRKRIALVLQLTYGQEDAVYLGEIRTALQRLGCKFLLLESYMDDEQVARLRLATDVFIHAQTTDALCATIQEYLYAGARVLNPVWLPYADLKNCGIEYTEYTCFEQLPSLIGNLLNGNPRPQKTYREALREMSSWENLSTECTMLYYS